jgi:sphingosine-1-phosphate phosphatase 1
MNYQLGIIRGPPLDPPYSVIWPSYSMLGLSLLRLMIGLCILVASRAIIKCVLYTIFHKILNIPKRSDLVSSIFKSRIFFNFNKHFNDLLQNNARKIEVFAELSQKYISYCVIGFNIVYLAPAVFRLAGIERPTFHTEV